jgi:hypothetical protein
MTAPIHEVSGTRPTRIADRLLLCKSMTMQLSLNCTSVPSMIFFSSRFRRESGRRNEFRGSLLERLELLV